MSPSARNELTSATERGNAGDVSQLLTRCSPDFITSDNRCPLGIAVCGGHEDLALEILAHPKSRRLINHPCSRCGYTPLGRAIKAELPRVVEALVRHVGIDPDAMSYFPAPKKFAATPVLVAAEMNAVVPVRLLLQRGADARLGKDNGCSPMHHSVMFGAFEVTKLLLEHAPSLTEAQCPDCKGDPLYVAATNPENVPAEKMNAVVSLLLDYGATPKLSPYHSLTPINWAVYWRNVGMLEMFAKRGLRNPPGSLALQKSFDAGGLSALGFDLATLADMEISALIRELE